MVRRILPALLCVALAGPGMAAEGLGPEAAERLERLVVQDCGSCHGLTMKGGLGSPITPDLMRAYDRRALSTIILDGIPGTAMPPWRALLSEAEALWIADYLQGTHK